MPTVRGHNEGSLFLRSRDNRWVASVTMPNGRRRSMSARSKTEGVQALRELLRQRDAAVPQDPRHVRLGPYLERWLDDVKPRLALATWRKHESIVRVHLAPVLGGVRLSNLSVDDVQGYLARSPLDPQSVRHHRATLRRALQDAVRSGVLTLDSTRGHSAALQIACVLLSGDATIPVCAPSFGSPMSHGHVCPICAGVGTIRQRGRPGWERVPCPRCSGSGTLRPA
jgi:hypothetical protein